MTRKLIHFDPNDAGYLHCDACHYDLPDKLEWGPHLLGYPCPKCCANMLTEKDYHNTDKLLAAVEWINKWFGWLGPEHSELNKTNTQEISVRLHDDTMTISK